MYTEIKTEYIKTLYEYNGSDITCRRLEIYRYFIERKILNIPRDKTLLYKLYHKAVKEGREVHGTKYTSDINRRIDYLEDLFNDIKKNGILEPIDVFIGTSGEYVVYDGHHRLAISEILGNKTIPIRILFIRKEWVDMKDEMEKEYGRKSLYNPIDHPDFVDWEIIRDKGRLKAILDRTGDLYGNIENDFVREKVLDIGCHMGHFSVSLARCGANVTGVEGNQYYINVANKISQFHNIPIKFVREDAWVYMRNNKDKYDYGLCLSFLHHYLIDKATELVKLMTQCTDIIYVDIGQEKEMKNIDLIKIFKKLNFKHLPIFEDKDGRILYEFKKS